MKEQENSKYAFIKHAILIDERRIELYWNSQMRRADNEEDFLVRYKGKEQALVHWTSDMSWDYGSVYQKESIKTTLCLVNPIPVSNAGDITVQLTTKLKDVMDRPVDTDSVYTLTYEPYYRSELRGKSGIRIKAGKSVSDRALELAASIVDLMLEKIPDVQKELIRRKAEIAVFGLKENAYDIPEHRMGYLLATRHVGGLGGDMENPLSSVSEANLIRLRSGRYATMYPHEMVLVHEFGHAIHLVGFNGLKDKTMQERIKETYEHARLNDLWPDSYAISNYEEYFATLGTIWFNVMQEGVDGKWDGIRGPVNTREELAAYDTKGYELMRDIYPEKTLPAPWHYNRDEYDINGKQKSYNIPDKFSWDFIE